jgi:hypothetical protein
VRVGKREGEMADEERKCDCGGRLERIRLPAGAFKDGDSMPLELAADFRCSDCSREFFDDGEDKPLRLDPRSTGTVS